MKTLDKTLAAIRKARKQSLLSLISLWDMIEFAGRLIFYLETIKFYEAHFKKSGSAEVKAKDRRELVRILKEMGPFFEELELRGTLDGISTLQLRLKGLGVLPDRSCHAVQTELGSLRYSIQRETQEIRIAIIKPDKTRLFQNKALFGSEVAKCFPNAQLDIQEAGNCLALGLNTAAVFHLMRTVELALRALARHLKVPLKKGHLEYLEWNTIIEQIEKTIAQMKQKPRGKKKAEALEFYHGAMGEFNAFKDAWRNNVMHTRGSYNEHQAMGIYLHVRSFIQRLVRKVSE